MTTTAQIVAGLPARVGETTAFGFLQTVAQHVADGLPAPTTATLYDRSILVAPSEWAAWSAALGTGKPRTKRHADRIHVEAVNDSGLKLRANGSPAEIRAALAPQAVTV